MQANHLTSSRINQALNVAVTTAMQEMADFTEVDRVLLEQKEHDRTAHKVKAVYRVGALTKISDGYKVVADNKLQRMGALLHRKRCEVHVRGGGERLSAKKRVRIGDRQMVIALHYNARNGRLRVLARAGKTVH